VVITLGPAVRELLEAQVLVLNNDLVLPAERRRAALFAFFSGALVASQPAWLGSSGPGNAGRRGGEPAGCWLLRDVPGPGSHGPGARQPDQRPGEREHRDERSPDEVDRLERGDWVEEEIQAVD